MIELARLMSEMTGLAQTQIWQAALVFMRVGGMIALLPVLGEQIIPVRIRLVSAVCLTMIVLPTQASTQGQIVTSFGPFLAEAFCGLLLGLSLRLIVIALQMAGTIIAQSTSLSQMFAGTGPEPQPVIGNLLVMVGLATFVLMNGPAKAVTMIVLSYDLFPPGQLPSPAMVAEWDVARVTSAFNLSFTLSMPFVLAALLYNLALGAINRAIPQLMVSLVGAPALAMGGIALLAIAVPFLLPVWQSALDSALLHPLGQ